MFTQINAWQCYWHFKENKPFSLCTYIGVAHIHKKKTWRDKIKNNPDLIQIPFPKICKHCSANTSLNYTILSSKQQGAMNKTLIREVPLWMAFKWLGFCLRLSNISSSESTVHFPPRITSILNTLMTPETYWWK